MANVCLLPAKHQEDCGEEMNKDLEDMIEDVENISVQLTWMAYDIVVQRTSPELSDSLRKLEEEYLRCKAAICSSSGDQGQEKDPRQKEDQDQDQNQDQDQDQEELSRLGPGQEMEYPKPVDHTATTLSEM